MAGDEQVISPLSTGEEEATSHFMAAECFKERRPARKLN